MKRFLHPICCGISGKKDAEGNFKFRVDFETNSDNDAIQFIEPYFYKSSIDDEVYWFGYKFNGKLDTDYRDQFIAYLKDVQWAPDLEDEFDEFVYDPDKLSDVDLTKMLRRSLNSLNINSYNIDTVVYPVSSTNTLVKSIVSCMSRILKNSDRLSYVEVAKSDPSSIQLDIEQCLYDIELGRLNNPGGIITEDYLYNLLEKIRSQDTFSLRRDIRPMSLRLYVSNFLEVSQVARKVETAANILIVDDIKSSGTTIQEIISIIRKYNSDAAIYVFTLIGKR